MTGSQEYYLDRYYFQSFSVISCRYDSEGDDISESLIIPRPKTVNNDDAVRNALRNLVIADDPGDTHHYFHIETPSTQVSMN